MPINTSFIKAILTHVVKNSEQPIPFAIHMLSIENICPGAVINKRLVEGIPDLRNRVNIILEAIKVVKVRG